MDVAKAAENEMPQVAKSDLGGAELLELIIQSLESDKAEDIVQIDLRGRSSIGDYMVVASGRSTRQVAAMSIYTNV